LFALAFGQMVVFGVGPGLHLISAAGKEAWLDYGECVYSLQTDRNLQCFRK
jgi:hypothetical protein